MAVTSKSTAKKKKPSSQIHAERSTNYPVSGCFKVKNRNVLALSLTEMTYGTRCHFTFNVSICMKYGQKNDLRQTCLFQA